MSAALEYDEERIFIDCPDCGQLHLPAPSAAFDELLRTACTTVEATTQELYKKFRVGEHDGRWDMDDDQGLFSFTHSDGKIADCDYGYVGTWIEETHSFKWAWDHPYATPATEAPAKRVESYGHEHEFEVLTSNLLKLNEHEAWHLTSIAAYLSDLPMTYRAKVNEKAWLFFVLDTPEWRTMQ